MFVDKTARERKREARVEGQLRRSLKARATAVDLVGVACGSGGRGGLAGNQKVASLIPGSS